MKRLRILLLLAALLALGAGWYALESRNPARLLDRFMDLAAQKGAGTFNGSKLQGNATQGNPLEQVAGLAIQGINLFQGNKGVELWRLKASWAHMSQNGDIIEVDKPVVRYALGEPSSPNAAEDFLDVQAEKGRITDNQRFLTLWDDVVITRFDDTITSSRMDYNAATRTMTFPEGAALESPTASGTASLFTWDLETNIMHGSNGVLVILKTRETPSEEKAASPEPQTPASEANLSLQPATAPSHKE